MDFINMGAQYYWVHVFSSLTIQGGPLTLNEYGASWPSFHNILVMVVSGGCTNNLRDQESGWRRTTGRSTFRAR